MAKRPGGAAKGETRLTWQRLHGVYDKYSGGKGRAEQRLMRGLDGRGSRGGGGAATGTATFSRASSMESWRRESAVRRGT